MYVDFVSCVDMESWNRHPKQYVEEKVRVKARRFNSLLNREEEAPDYEEEARQYLRASRGG